MSANLPILYQNIMYGLQDGIAQDAFLWAAERPENDRNCYVAERFAREVHHLVERVRPMIEAAERAAFKTRSGPLMAEGDAEDLMNFILKRHANWRFGGNLHPKYAMTHDGMPQT